MKTNKATDFEPPRKARGKDRTPRKRRQDKHAGPGRPPSGPESRNVVLHVAVTPTVKTLYAEQANAAGLSLSEAACRILEGHQRQAALRRRVSSVVAASVDALAAMDAAAADLLATADVFAAVDERGKEAAFVTIGASKGAVPLILGFATEELSEMTDVMVSSILSDAAVELGASRRGNP